MDELIVLLIKGIIRLFSGPPAPPQRRFTKVPQGLTRARVEPVRQTAPAARRPPARRPRQTSVVAAVAAPIITRSAAPQAAARRPAAAATATKPPTAATVQVRRWLTPVALRQQIVLAEILRPPLALRDEA